MKKGRLRRLLQSWGIHFVAEGGKKDCRGSAVFWLLLALTGCTAATSATAIHPPEKQVITGYWSDRKFEDKTLDFVEWTCAYVPETVPDDCQEKTVVNLYRVMDERLEWAGQLLVAMEENHIRVERRRETLGEWFWQFPLSGERWAGGFALTGETILENYQIGYDETVTDEYSYQVSVTDRLTHRTWLYKGRPRAEASLENQKRELVREGTGRAFVEIEECNGRVEGMLYFGCIRIPLQGYDRGAEESLNFGVEWNPYLTLHTDSAQQITDVQLWGYDFTPKPAEKKTSVDLQPGLVWVVSEFGLVRDYLFWWVVGDLKFVQGVLSQDVVATIPKDGGYRFWLPLGKNWGQDVVRYSVNVTGDISAEYFRGSSYEGHTEPVTLDTQVLHHWYPTAATKAWLAEQQSHLPP